jgi:RNA polymerase sigma-70 factor (ECF subfamily)
MSGKYQRWVVQYHDAAWALARYLLKDASEAEDAVQEAVVKLRQHEAAMEPDRVRPWLLTVVRNNCLDRLRRHRPDYVAAIEHSVVDTARLAGEQPGLAARDGPEDILSRGQAAAWLRHLIDQLDEPNRSLVVLRDLMQLSYAEVGEATGLSLSQVKVYLHRARRRLRDQLETADD